MNVLILTPDAVGSTLLQRLITIYMQFHSYDRPVINLHELTNGLIKYHNTKFDREVLGKQDGKWGYYQSLKEIVNLLDSVDHYKTSRLAHYHLLRRQDSMADQVPFYEYLNENFYIISCRRHNLFEHALSWSLSKVTKKLNVYQGREKIDTFFDLYRNGIDLDPNSLLQTLNFYKLYVNWCNNHFNVANYFYYEEHLPRIENYILNLPIFSQQNKLLSWKDNFGINFDNWNLCHHVTSDIGTLALDQPEKFAQLKVETNVNDIIEKELLIGYRAVKDQSWPEINSLQEYNDLPQTIKDEVEKVHKISTRATGDLVGQKVLSQPLINSLPIERQEFYSKNQKAYETSINVVDRMINDGIIINGPPIKKQTLAEKKHIIRNFQHLLDVYNKWIEMNPEMGQPLDNDTLDRFADIERTRWNPTSSAIALVDQ